jgi:peptidoglycan/xylan/chitin deacetylase (PgdA/CDA1 family)
MRRSLLALALIPMAAVAAGEPALPQAYFETVEQRITIEFRTVGAAAKAKITPATLYEDKRLAISNRWDDNAFRQIVQTAKMSQKMGIRGTFYLNGAQPDHFEEFKKAARAAVAAGQSVGNHKWSHPVLSVQNDHRRFEELARCRAFIEQHADAPVNAVAWAFVNAGVNHNLANSPGMERVAEAMFRSGHIGHAQSYGLSVGRRNIGPQTGDSWGSRGKDSISAEHIDGLLSKIIEQGRDRCIWLMGIHPGRYKFAEEFDRLKDVPSIPGLWHCTFNEYVAYRNQVLRTKIATQQDGKVLNVKLVRPVLLDLGDDIPLTLKVEGVGAEAVVAVRADDATVTPAQTPNGPYMFHLSHTDTQALPTEIGAVYNDANEQKLLADVDFGALKGNMYLDGETLHWTVQNASKAALTGVRLTARLPIAYTDGVQALRIDDVAAGGEESGQIKLTLADDDYTKQVGTAFFMLQLDGVLGGEAPKPIRFYMTASKTMSPKRDVAYPLEGFTKLGPIPTGTLDEAQLLEISAARSDTYRTPEGKALKFFYGDFPLPERLFSEAGKHLLYDAEFVPTTGAWRLWSAMKKYEATYLSRSEIDSAEVQTAVSYSSANVTAIYVNGAKLVPKEEKRHRYRTELPLKKGKNLVVIVSTTKAGGFIEKAGFFFRLTPNDPAVRLKTIAYHPK